MSIDQIRASQYWHRMQAEQWQFGLKEVLFVTLCFAIFFFIVRPHFDSATDLEDGLRMLLLLPVSFAIGSSGFGAWII